MGFFSGLLSAAPLIGSALSFVGGERQNSAQSEQAESANDLTYRMHTESRDFNAEEALKNREFLDAQATTAHGRSSLEARRNRSWQERMSNTFKLQTQNATSASNRS